MGQLGIVIGDFIKVGPTCLVKHGVELGTVIGSSGTTSHGPRVVSHVSHLPMCSRPEVPRRWLFGLYDVKTCGEMRSTSWQAIAKLSSIAKALLVFLVFKDDD